MPVRRYMPFSSLSCAVVMVCHALVGCAPGEARTSTATPATLASRLNSARPGDIINLAAGDYDSIDLKQRRFAPALRIHAGRAVIQKVVIEGSDGIELSGGTIRGPGGRSYGILIRKSRNVAVSGMRVTGAHRGIVIDRSEGVTVERNAFVDLLSDGVNIALSRNVRVAANSCRDFRPTLATYDAAGTRLQDGDHPDCIQAWSRPEAPPVSDITIVDNDIEGQMQGIFFGNKVRNGVDDGGFDRVVIVGNRVLNAYPNGIAMEWGRNSIVRDNTVSAIRGATYVRRPGVQLRSNINIRGENNLVCGNTVPDMRKGVADRPCPTSTPAQR